MEILKLIKSIENDPNFTNERRAQLLQSLQSQHPNAGQTLVWGSKKLPSTPAGPEYFSTRPTHHHYHSFLTVNIKTTVFTTTKIDTIIDDNFVD